MDCFAQPLPANLQRSASVSSAFVYFLSDIFRNRRRRMRSLARSGDGNWPVPRLIPVPDQGTVTAARLVIANRVGWAADVIGLPKRAMGF